MENAVTILDWDSEFFGKKICRVQSNIEDEEALLNITELLAKQNIALAYYSSVSPLPNSLTHSDKYFITLVDKKTTYKKIIQKNLPVDTSVIAYGKEYPEPKLLDLAVESGVCSRFKVDEKIGVSKFEELYRTWMINSVNKKIAKEVLVYRVNDTIAGFVTLSEKNARADIGIIAVDKDFRGRGIGRSLMLAAENWFVSNTGFEEIQVVTQGANKAACKLYESCGYKVDKVEYFYHLWKKDNIAQ